jgi:hypothetical protein
MVTPMQGSNGTPPEEDWSPARLIPTYGIKNEKDQEKRATSALLAVMHAVPEFAHAVLGPLGAPKAAPKTYAEVRFKTPDGELCIPDGAIVVERGKKRWTCLVEVKTGRSELQSAQVSTYLDIARDNNYDAVLTISNQITSADAKDSPVSVDKRKLRRVDLFHFSWLRIATEAIVQHRFRGVTDPDQAWILGELIAYLDSEASGASGFDDMGSEWVTVRDAAHAGTLRAGKEVQAVAARWDQFVEYVALGLAQELGTDVSVVAPRNQTRTQRTDQLAKDLLDSGRLTGTIKVPATVSPLELTADLRSRQVETTVTLSAPKEGRPTARINWLLRQMREAPPSLRVTVSYEGARESVSAALGEARENPAVLLSPTDPKRAPRAFAITLLRAMGKKRGKGRGSFIGDTRLQAFDCYREVLQVLKPWQQRAPKLPNELVSTAESEAQEPSDVETIVASVEPLVIERGVEEPVMAARDLAAPVAD